MNPFRQSSNTKHHSEMSVDKEELAALVDKSVTESMQKSIDILKETFEKSGKDQADSLRSALQGSVNDILATVTKRQDEYEAKTEQRFKDQEIKSDKRFLDFQKQLDQISKGSGKAHDIEPVQQSLQPPPSLLPLATHDRPVSVQARPEQIQQHSNHNQLDAIKEIIAKASTILGIGPISCDDIDAADGETDEQKLNAAVIDFLRNEIAIKESEISDSDIHEVFPANDPDLQRIYVKFATKEQAKLCLDLTRRLRKPELQVVLYIPRELRDRFHAMKNEDYRLRKLGQPRHKTRIEYTETDLMLYACPLGHFRYSPYPIPDLPAVDLAPLRTPPKGRKSKRPRDDSNSPPGGDKKNARVTSPSLAASAPGIPPPNHSQGYLNFNVSTKSS